MPRFVSLYSGAGGLDLGFIAAGFEPIFANDINGDATATYREALQIISRREGFSCVHEVVTGDIRQVEMLPAKGSADLVVGGPPCQGFSVAGKMDPNDPRSRHVFDFLGMVERVQPKVFVMENVKALAMNKRWAGTIADIRKKAEEIGYKTYLKVLNSSDYGVPQARERMFLVGFKDHSVEYEYPEPTCDKPVTVADAFKALPAIGEPGNDQTCSAKITPAKEPILRQSPYVCRHALQWTGSPDGRQQAGAYAAGDHGWQPNPDRRPEHARQRRPAVGRAVSRLTHVGRLGGDVYTVQLAPHLGAGGGGNPDVPPRHALARFPELALSPNRKRRTAEDVLRSGTVRRQGTRAEVDKRRGNTRFAGIDEL